MNCPYCLYEMVGKSGRRVCPKCGGYEVNVSDPSDYNKELSNKERKLRFKNN